MNEAAASVMPFGGGEQADNEAEQLELEKLRNKHREKKLAYREDQRKFLLKRARFLGKVDPSGNLPPDDITSMAKSLKNKSQVSCELLKAVVNALVDQENITEFLKVDGALQALLRVLSGKHEKFQLLAAECICTLALGSQKESFQVLKAAESYLMMHLSGRNSYIKETCVIALGNFSRHGSKNIELLLNQDCFTKIINFLKESDQNMELSAIYALTQMVYHGYDFLRVEDLENCLLAVLPIFKTRGFSVVFLLSVLSSGERCQFCYKHFLSNEIHSHALRSLLILLREGEKEALYYLRIVGNSILDESGQILKDLIENHWHVVRECIRCLLQSKESYLKKECLRVIGNMANHPVEMFKPFAEELVKENFESLQQFMKECHGSEEMV